ncbi:cofilin [Linnemannia zychae]|nr:cofilin [Linnemannia zychae]
MVPYKQLSSGVAASDACFEAFNKLKLEHKFRYIIFKLSEDYKQIVVEKTSDDNDYDAFLRDLPRDDCRYATYDFEFEKEGKRNMILFYNWAPDAAKIKSKMVFASSASTFRKCFVGIADDIQGTDYDEISHDAVLEKVTRRIY